MHFRIALLQPNYDRSIQPPILPERSGQTMDCSVILATESKVQRRLKISYFLHSYLREGEDITTIKCRTYMPSIRISTQLGYIHEEYSN